MRTNRLRACLWSGLAVQSLRNTVGKCRGTGGTAGDNQGTKTSETPPEYLRGSRSQMCGMSGDRLCLTVSDTWGVPQAAGGVETAPLPVIQPDLPVSRYPRVKQRICIHCQGTRFAKVG